MYLLMARDLELVDLCVFQPKPSCNSVERRTDKGLEAVFVSLCVTGNLLTE